MKYIIPLIVFIMLSVLGNAQVEIVSIFNPGIDRSNGYINVQAVGSAEPFRMVLWKDDAKVAETPSTYISGIYSFRDLPEGTYTVKIWDKLNCITQYEVVLVEEYFCSIELTLIDFKHSTSFYTEECSTGGFDEVYLEGTSADGVLEIVVNSNETTRVEWKGPGGFTSDALRIENLAAGFYEVTVYDIGDASCKKFKQFSVLYCDERHGGCEGDRSLLYDGWLDGVLQESPVEFELANKTSPSGMACNGALEIKVDSKYGSDYFYTYWTDEQTGATYGGNLLENLCPGDYTFHVIDGCNQDKVETYTLVDCDIEPLMVEAVNECRDPRYTNFPVIYNGGIGSQIFGPFEEGNTVKYVVKDSRGCTVEKVFAYANIDDFDFTVELVKPKTLFGSPIVIVTLTESNPLYEPYILYQNGESIELTPYAPTELLLTEGTEGINRFILQNSLGCELVKDVDLQSCGEVPELEMSTLIDYSNTGELSIPNKFGLCNDHSFLHLTIKGGIPKYRIRIESLDEEVPWLYEDEKTESIIDVRIDQALPKVPISITIIDECENRIYEEIEPCDGCNFRYQSDGDRFFVGNDGGIQIRVDRPCGQGWGSLGGGTDINVVLSNGQIADWEFPITIEYPDNEIQTISRNEDGDLIGLSKDNWSLNNVEDAGPQIVKITRGDGCMIELPIEIKEEETTYGYFVQTKAGPALYIGSAKCKTCNALSADAQDLSVRNCGGDLIQFFYEPINMSNPCAGGLFRYSYYDNEEQKNKTFEVEIGPGVSLGEASKESGDFFWGNCVDIGTCLFPSSIIPAIGPGSIPLAASFCLDGSDIDDPNDPCKEIICEAPMICNGDGECVYPCDKSVVSCDEVCIDGVCVVIENLCDIYVHVNNEPGKFDAINISHNLKVDDIVVMNFNTYQLADRITVSQDGIVLNDPMCISTDGKFETEVIEIISTSPIHLDVDVRNCTSSRESKFELEFTCPD